MSIQNYLRSLIVKGWEFWLKEGSLAYRAVKNDDTASILAQLKEHKEELLSILNERPEVLQVAPVSDGQLSYWIEWQRNPHDSSAHVPFSFRIRSEIVPEKLEQAINAVMARHDALRSIFLFEGGQLIQQILPPDQAHAEFNQFDVSDEGEAGVKLQVIEGHNKPFELESKPPVRMDLYSWNDTDHVLMLSIHHTVIDGLSHAIVLQEFIDNYEKLCRDIPLDTSPAKVPYSEYAHWQHRLIKSQRWEQMEQYWHDSLSGAQTLLQLPQKAERSTENAVQRSVVKVNIDEVLYSQLEQFTRSVGTTKYVALLAAYEAAIYRYSGQRDLLIGSPLLGRSDHRFDDVVGYFINTVVLRAKMNDSLDFKSLLNQTSKQILGAIDNQDYLFSHLIDKLKPERHPGATPFFQAWFNLNKYWQFSKSSQQLSATAKTDSGLVMDRYDIGGQEANFDLVLLMEDNDQQLRGEIKYNADIYDPQMIEDLAQDFVAILEQVIKYPEVALSDIHLIADDRKAAADELISNSFSLSPQQSRMWQQRNLLLKNAVTLGLKVSGRVDHHRLKQAVETILNQHEIFSTRFVRHPLLNSLLQMVGEVNLNYRELPGANSNKSLSELQVWALALEQAQRERADVTESFVDCFLVDCVDDGTMLILQMHPLFADGTLIHAVSDQIARCYHALVSGNEWQLEDPVQYIDIAEWTKQLLNSEDAEEGKQFWQQVPLTEEQITPLKLDQMGSRIAEFDPISVNQTTLDEGMVQKIHRLTQEKEMGEDGIQHWLFSAWQLLLNRLSSNRLSVVGCRFDGRSDEDTKTVVGPLARFLPVSTAINDEQTAIELVQENITFAETAEGYQECFQWPNDGNHQVNALPYLFEYDQLVSDWKSANAAIQLKPFAVHSEVFNLKLSCQHDSTQNSVKLVLHINAQAFNVGVAELLMQQYMSLLQEMLQHPDNTLAALEIVDADQRTRILSFNDERQDFANDQLIHQLIRLQGEDLAKKIAIRCQHHAYSYAQMNELVARYTQALMDARVNKGDFVGVFARHSSEAVIATLAIMHAGGIYVPLDPEYPAERLQYIAEDCQLKTVFVGTEVADLALESGIQGVKTIALDLAPENRTAAFPHVPIEGADGAYLIYTSGSTGKPKGTLISHQALVDHAWSVTKRFGTTEKDTVLLFAPLNFDPSIEQGLTPLMLGATVHVRDQQVWQPSEIAAKVKQYGLTLINFPTAFWHLLVQDWERSLDPADVATLRLVVSGGDKLLPELAKRWWNLGLKDVRLINAYGPTETTITASTADIDGPQCLQYHQASIGKPLCNRSMYLLDAQLRLVPVGSEGELYIGGVGLATEYLHRPELTEQAFLQDPFVDAPDTENTSTRMYRTGDRAFYDEQGNMYFVGRADTQVKIRGYRIEPMEVEQRVNQSPLVREAAVIIREQGDDNKQIVVCYVPAQSGPVEDELQSFLSEQLPEYMLPHLFVQLDEMPLSPSGKIERNKLQALIVEYKPEVNRSEPPETATEIALAEIWQTLVGVEQINRFDHFAQLGGHSLLFMKLLSQIGERFNVNLKLKDVFEAGDLEAQARLIDTALDNEQDTRAPLVKVESSQALPLSFAQESMWLVSHLGQSLSYQMSGILHFYQPLNLNILQQCIDQIVARHGSLRTCFMPAEDGARQLIMPSVELPIEVVEIEVAGEEKSVLKQWHSRAFDFTQGPLMRVLVLRSNDGGDTLGICLHHIISDGFSTNILLNEMAALYGAYQSGNLVALEPLPIQYHDYAVWERLHLTADVFERSLDYWQQQLTGYEDLDIMPRYSRPKQLSGMGHRVDVVVPPNVDKGLQALCEKAGVSQTAVLVGAVKLLLNQYSENKDFCLGLPTANRDRKELEGVVGMLVNILVVRLGPQEGDESSLFGYLQHTHQTIQQGLMHLDVPFDRLVGHLQPERDLSRNPIFQVFVSYIEFTNVLQFGDQKATFKPYDGNQARFDLSFDFGHNSHGDLTLALEYSSDLFSSRFISDLIENLHFVLAQLANSVANEQRHNQHQLQQIRYVDPTQINMQVAWGEGPVMEDVEPRRFQVVDLMDKNIILHGESRALSCNEQYLTYAEFGRRVNYIAAYLQAQGIKEGDFVGVSVIRSLNTSLAMVAVLKLGAVYVPIDPTLPEQRIGYILDDSGTKIILTDEFSSANLTSAAAEGMQLIVLDAEAKIISTQNDIEAIGNDAKPVMRGRLDVDKLAYVIYTSGSTGNPKGVMISLAAVTHCIYAMRDVVDFVADDSMLAVATTSFDISVLDLLLPVCFGGELIIADDNTVKNADALSMLLDVTRASLMQATPATWEMLFESGWTNPTRTRLLSIGEPISTKLHRAFEAHNCRIWNGYGPTEATIYATAKDLVMGCQMSIGQAIGHYKVYILDKEQKSVPTGVPGELYIGGPAVGMGYLNKPDLTASVFLDNPFRTGEKYYKTGDLVRWIEQDGVMEIEYISRIDQQVKLRGYRIELGEVESSLDALGLFSQIAVVLRDTPTGQQLVAYLVLREPSRDLDPVEVKSELGHKLPGYMLPAYLELLDEMPLTPSKKFDKKALKQRPMKVQGGASAGDGRKMSETETRLQALWQKLFNSEQIGELDNFFQLGGHSLLLINLQNQIQQVFDVEFQLADLFKSPTLREMARLIDRQSGQMSPSIIPQNTPSEVGLSYNQQGLWLVDKMAEGTNAYNIIYGIRLAGDIRPDLLLQAWQQVQQRQQSLRTHFEFANGNTVQKISEQLLSEIPTTDISVKDKQDQQEAIEQHIQQEFEHVFDLAADNLFRIQLLKEAEDSYVMLLNIHHIIFDGWSARILVSEIMACYDALLNGGPFMLDELPVQYTDFAHWQRQCMQDGDFASQMEYWQRHLNNCPTESALPYDHPFPETADYDGAALKADFDIKTIKPLRDLAISQNTTLFTVMLSAWNLLLYLETGKTDIQIGTDVANRTKPTLESLIGFFMNQVPLRTRIIPDQSVSAFVELVGEICLDAFANQEVPFEQLVRNLNVDRVGGRSPLFQGKFFMDNLPNEVLRGSNFSMEALVIEQEAARLPLNFSLVDTGHEVVGKLVYNIQVFDNATVERMLRRYRAILPLLPEALDSSLQMVVDQVLSLELDQQEQARQVLREEKLKSFKSRSRRNKQTT